MHRTFEQWLTWMESCHPAEIELGLKRCRTVLDRLLEGKLNCPIITVAGTNGKGSTLAVLEALAKQANIKPLLFTSPEGTRRFLPYWKTGYECRADTMSTRICGHGNRRQSLPG